ncbi:LAGLIDADG family homing endonuclease [Patescibacteria group bacterium]|nr:LAGLIDADG family homing endonuclease [Patescibacteria group bacterium]
MSYFREQPLNPNKKLQAYIIGVALGDGNLSNSNNRAVRLRISCDKKYPLLIKHIIYKISILLPNNNISKINRKNCIDISCYSNHWSKLLWNWDKGPKDVQNVFVPNWIKNDLELSKECLRGLFQTDGSIYTDRNYIMVNFVNTTPNLSNDVLEMIRNLGFKPNIQKLKQDNKKIKHTIRITKDSEKFIKEIKFWKK